MNFYDIQDMMPPFPTISECKKEVGLKNPAHSSGKPDLLRKTNNLRVRFAPLSESMFELEIKRVVSKPAQLKPAAALASLFCHAGAGHNPG